KTSQGFYKRAGKDEFHALDLATLEYRAPSKPRFPEADAARAIEDLGDRLRALTAGKDRAGTFLWKLFSYVFLYSADRIPEIADRIVEVDRAMRWGYAHKLGPFELWDALGFENVCSRLERESRALPPNVEAMRRAGATSFYEDSGRRYFDFGGRKHETFDPPG